MKCDISALFCTKNYVKNFKTRENIQFQHLMHCAVISVNYGKPASNSVWVEEMKIHFTYACPNHSGVGVIDKFDLSKNDCKLYHNRKMVTVNESAYKIVKKH